MKKRLLAIVMTMAMALSLLPVTALADGADIGSQPAGQVQEDPDLGNTGGGGDDPLPGDGPNEGDDPSLPEDEDPSLPPPNNTIPMADLAVAAVDDSVTMNGTPYDSLSEALKAVSSSENAVISLPSGEHTIDSVTFENGEHVTILGNGESETTISVNGQVAFHLVNDDASLTLEDLTVVVNDNSKNGARVVRMVNGDDMSFSAENVTFETPSEAASTNNIALYINGAWNESGLTQSSGVNVSLTNFTYEDDSAHSGLYFQNYSDIDLSVQQSSLTVDKYAINIQANTAASIDISGCEIQGWTAYYAYSCNTNTTITDSTLIGINHFSGPSNNFGTIVLDGGELQDIPEGDSGFGNTLYITDSDIQAKTTAGNYQVIVSCNYGASANKIVFSDCTFQAEGTANGNDLIPLYGSSGQGNQLIVDGLSMNTDSENYLELIPAAKIGDQGFGTLEAAVEAADGDTIVMLTDVAVGNAQEQKDLSIDKSITIDLNGHELKGLYQTAITVNNPTANVTVKDGILVGTNIRGVHVISGSLTLDGIKLIGSVLRPVQLDTGSITILNSTIQSTGQGQYGVMSFGNKNTITINNSTISADCWAVYHNGSYHGFALSAENSTFESKASDCQGIYVSGSTATTTANNGINQQIKLTNCTVSGQSGIEGKYTDIELNNCEITATAEKVEFEQNNNGSTANGFAVVSTDNSMSPDSPKPTAKITINGGTYTGLIGLSQLIDKAENPNFAEATYIVTGGTFSSDPTNYLAPGYEAFQNGDVYVVGKPVENITLNKSELSMYLNTEETLTATVTPDEAYDHTVAWTSNAPEYVSVENGVVKALKVTAEPVTITAEAGGKTAVCQVTVTNAPVGALTLDHTKLSMVEGGAAKLTAEVEPENADQTVTWTTSDEEVAIVSDNGTVTAVKAGAATITAKAGGLTAECQVTVTAKEEDATVIPSVEKPQVDTGDKVPEDVKDVVTEAAESVAADKALSDAAAQQSQQVESKKDELVEQAKQDGLNVSEDQDVNLYTQVYMEIQVEAAKVENGDITSITMDITPVVKVIASTADSSAEIQIGTNAVEVRSEKLELTQASITVQLPDTFESKLVYVKHEASGNNIYYYKAAANGNGVLTFATRDGFSPFTFSVTPFEDVAAWIGSEGYASLEAAVSTVENNGTIVLAKDNSEKIEVRRNITFTIDPADKSFEPKNITAGSRYDMSLKVNEIQGEGGTVTHTYTYDFDRDSSGGSSSSGSYAVSVDAGKHGSVKVSPSRADKGDTVTITVKPDDGYELDELTVTDKDGDSIKLKDKGDGRFTFTMPASKVTVEAVFTALEQEEEQPLFSDVAEDDWYYDAVAYVAENGIMSGTDGSRFSPNGTLTRAMLSQILYAMEDKPAVSGAATFSDVAAGAWYADAVNWTEAQGIVAGMGENSFAPDAPVTREQLSLILYGYARYKGYDTSASVSLSGYADRDSVAVWAADSMGWAVSEGLISGRPGGYLDPAGTAIRAEVAQILMNFCEDLAR